MVTLISLASGSSGNCFYLSAGAARGGILIDAGLSAKRTCAVLRSFSVAPETVEAVLLTHSHADHASGAGTLAKLLGIPIYGAPETIDAIRGPAGPEADLRAFDGPFSLASVEVVPFATPHDAEGSVGFRLTAGERSIGFATDLGEMTDGILARLRGVDLAVIESNYDEERLRTCVYPPVLKRRIRSGLGHLSNADAARAAVRLCRTGTSRFLLAHLSAESNLPELALETAKDCLARAGYREGRDYRIRLARRDGPSEPIVF